MEIFSLPSVQALLAGLGSWFSISLGAAFIFLRKEFSPRLLENMLGTAGGMMLGATFFALLLPSLQLSEHWGHWAFVPAVVGLLLGTLFLRGFDALLPHIHTRTQVREGMSASWQRSVLLVAAMALHHIPEGLAIGVSYGATAIEPLVADTPSWQGAALLTLSMMLQGIPEGTVVSMALLGEGLSKNKAFFFGILSGCTTPIGAIFGVFMTGVMQQILPIALAFAAGAMLYIIVEDIIPESQASGHGNEATMAVIGGLILVIILQTLFS